MSDIEGTKSNASAAIVLLLDGFQRVHEEFAGVADGVSAEQMTQRPGGTGNSIGWLLWHLARVQDDHIADLAGREQVWTADGWFDRFGLPFEHDATGYGQSSDDVDSVVVTTELLEGYHEAVNAMTVAFVEGLRDDDFERVVDDSYDPPVTAGVRIVSVLNDCLQHVGQAAYVKGLGDRS